MLSKEFLERPSNITAKVVADSISESGQRITTFEIEYPRFILAELNTHRCLSGDTMLSFDLPSGVVGKRRKHLRMSVKDFHDKWHNGMKSRTNNTKKDLDLSGIEDDVVYSCKDLGLIVNYGASNLRNLCRTGRLKSLNFGKKLRSEDYLVNGKDFKEFRSLQKTKPSKRQSMVDRLKSMNIRSLNTKTGLIENTKVTDIWSNGFKDVLKLNFEGGSLVGTKDHPILTQRGWVNLGDLNNEDYVLLSKSVKNLTPSEKTRFSKIGGVWRSQWQRDVKLKYVEDNGSVCQNCGVESKLEVHHIIPVHVDQTKVFDMDNIQFICESCHNLAHKKQGWQKSNSSAIVGVQAPVISVEETGTVEEVFDLSVESEEHNFLANGIVVHNCLSKNSSSSRAIPIKTMIDTILKNPATPLYWGSTKSGMQAGEELSGAMLEVAKGVWGDSMTRAVLYSSTISNTGLHKQTSNRLVEPFQMMKTVITGTDWDNFFNLRIHPDSQPEICVLAFKIYKAMQESEPMVLKSGEWHLPYVNTSRGVVGKDGESWDLNSEIIYSTGSLSDGDLSEPLTLEEAKRISASCCAQTSFRKSDDSLEKADKVFNMLVKADVIHSSPLEHQATPMAIPFVSSRGDIKYITNLRNPDTWEEGITHMNRSGVLCSGNLTGWIQFRHTLKSNTCWEFNFEDRMKLFKEDE